MRGCRVDVRLFDDLGAQRTRSLDGGVEVVHLEPQQHAMSRPRRVRVDQIRMIFLVPGVELEDQVTAAKEPIVVIAMTMLGESVDSEELSVPAAACPDVAHGDQRLGSNVCSSLPSFFHLFAR
jgi:hypothetical protein